MGKQEKKNEAKVLTCKVFDGFKPKQERADNQCPVPLSHLNNSFFLDNFFLLSMQGFLSFTELNNVLVYGVGCCSQTRR